MKNAMKTRSSSPPIHVHVSDDTPIHVHVKSQRTSPTRATQGKAKVDRGSLRPTAMVKTRAPSIPPGKAFIRDASYKWEGPTHHLVITPPIPEPEPEHSLLQTAELMSEQEEGLHRRISRYEKKVDSLLSEVSCLKNEVEVRKKEQQSISKCRAEQEEQLTEVISELEETEWENTLLRQSMEKLLEETAYNRVEDLQHDKDALLKKLLEAETDGAAAAEQVSALREAISSLSFSRGSRRRGSESSLLAHQKELLLQKLETFEATNRKLRHLLRDQHECQVDSIRLSEQKETLLKRLSDTEAENAHLVVKLEEKDRDVTQLVKRLETEKVSTKSSTDLSKSLDSARAHLQGHLRSKEAENNRLSVQMKNLERAANQQKAEMDHLTEQLTRLQREADANRQALKRAAQAQKQRAEHNEATAGQLSIEVHDMEKQVTDALLMGETWQVRCLQDAKDKSKLEVELSLLNSCIEELTQHLQDTQERGRMEREALQDQLRGLTTECTAATLENQSLKATLSAVEQKLSLSQSELQEVKDSINQYENLLKRYKVQVVKTQAEADEYASRLAQAEQEAKGVRGELEEEMKAVQAELLGQLAELESLPEALRRSEQQLKEAKDSERSLERRSTELGTTLTDFRLKVETQDSQMELFRQKNKVLLEENRQLQQRVKTFEKKLEEASRQNSDLLGVISKREAIIHSNQLLLEEKKRECSRLSQQLDKALDDAGHQISEATKGAATKEHSMQTKILELETKIRTTTAMINQLQCSKEEVEQQYQSRLQDVKDRLEQSDSTNRSLQNYVQFLKESYAKVFGDLALGS